MTLDEELADSYKLIDEHDKYRAGKFSRALARAGVLRWEPSPHNPFDPWGGRAGRYVEVSPEPAR